MGPLIESGWWFSSRESVFFGVKDDIFSATPYLYVACPKSLKWYHFPTYKLVGQIIKSICILPFALEIVLGLATMYALRLFLCGDTWGAVVV